MEKYLGKNQSLKIFLVIFCLSMSWDFGGKQCYGISQ